MSNKDRKKEFLEELTALTHKYGLAIAGCGCCGSPSLMEIGKETEGLSYSVDRRGDYLGLRSQEDLEEEGWTEEGLAED